jgi:hypothetical protein
LILYPFGHFGFVPVTFLVNLPLIQVIVFLFVASAFAFASASALAFASASALAFASASALAFASASALAFASVY